SHELADIAAFEAVNNPVGPADAPDSNPNAVLATRWGYVVADAGGNDLLYVSHSGRVRKLATFPTTTVGGVPNVQAVPTSVVRGPHGAYYVSQLTGGPFPEGGAAIWKVVPGHQPRVYAKGLTNVTDLAFGRHGRLYAVEIAEHGLLNGPIGAVVSIAPGGHSWHPIAEGLLAPYGIALRHHHAYVTTGSILPGGGKVVRIPLR
ncbi:MAG: ScyD/ScyE family protein, partial [Nocardioidaceae bacterium]